ncbi:conserved Plasmodium protein, unknown function [Plasmodium ovale]|uniref:Uncharacterized protein n=2 Tax=Plasmodium ovale TaxID=36330 RepID=A0A1A8W2G2_PLAOA|nr:hypothetical protein, conserved [Plasmodium ovale curtisi]SBS94418.1 hypothetical protein, conserved [Plasmodium ovale curtisi]SCP05068.1 conserved Plasmodium protein, unknown function [Plasmodium ovale]
MIKICFFQLLFLIYFCLNSDVIRSDDDGLIELRNSTHVDRSGGQETGVRQKQGLQNIDYAPLHNREYKVILEREKDLHGRRKVNILPEQRNAIKYEIDQSAVAKEKHRSTNKESEHIEKYVSDDKYELYDKMGKMSLSFSKNISSHISFVNDLFYLYNSNIDISSDNFKHGSIAVFLTFGKYEENAHNYGNLHITFFSSVAKINEPGDESGKSEFNIKYNIGELLEKKKPENKPPTTTEFKRRAGITENAGQSEDESLGDLLETHDTSEKVEELSKEPVEFSNICHSIYESNIDSKKNFFTVDKVSETEFAVSKLEDFLNACMKVETAEREADKKKKRGSAQTGIDKNEQADEHTRGQISGQTNGRTNTQENASDESKPNKTLLKELKQSLINKDLAACKEAYKLLMANSTATYMMYFLVFTILTTYLL